MSTQAIVAAIVAALLFAAGWLTEGLRKDSEILRIHAQYRQEQAKAAQDNLQQMIAAQHKADFLQTQLAAAESARDQLTQEKADAIRRLTVGRPCLGGAVVRVLNEPAKLPTQLPEATGQPVPADAAFATDTDVGLWANAARRAYDTCRGKLQALNDFYATEPPRE